MTKNAIWSYDVDKINHRDVSHDDLDAHIRTLSSSVILCI